MVSLFCQSHLSIQFFYGAFLQVDLIFSVAFIFFVAELGFCYVLIYGKGNRVKCELKTQLIVEVYLICSYLFPIKLC